jgi:urease accessory protein
LHQAGAAKIRLPHSHRGEVMDVVLINTSGGLAGGDRLGWEVTLGPGAQAVVTTQACERAYRTLGERAGVSVALEVGAGARLDWLPQETIIYNGSGLERRFEAAVAEDGVLLIVEPVLLGRLAYGERVDHAAFHDRWRIRRGNRLVFAEDTRLEGQVGSVADRAATLGGCAAFASVILISPKAERWLEPVRARLSGIDGDCCGGASAYDGKLICRLLAQDGMRLRRTLIEVLTVLRDGLGMPRSWAN